VTRDELSDALVGAVRDLVQAGALALPEGVPDRVVVERPRSRERVDYVSTVALQLAAHAGLPAGELADLLAARLRSTEGIEAVDVADPGFLNVRLPVGRPGSMLARVVDAGPSYGASRDVVGTVVVPEELVQRLGPDVARYAVARCGSAAAVDVEGGPWTVAAWANPAYRVQLTHARASALLRGAARLGVRPRDYAELLVDRRERDVLLAVADFPEAAAAATRRSQPHRLVHHLERAASAFDVFHTTCPVLPRGDEEPTPVGSARLMLVDATRIVLANGLRLLGVSAPERM
jgi:arginyl-tRNA synthetase